jgi:uncharacterized Zn-binding protein involved in type VI secretion
MPGIARIGDACVGICCGHSDPPCIDMTGIIASGAGTVSSEGALASRIGDIVVGGCGHVGIIVSGSSTVFIEGSNAARLGDVFAGTFTGTIVTGSGTVINTT